MTDLSNQLVCQCPEEGSVPEDRLNEYEAEKERPYVNHKPGECKCTNELTLWRRDGKELWLCSICCFPLSDEKVLLS